MIEYDFDPLFDTFEQKVARNIADSIYGGMEYGVHYLLIPAAYVGYKSIKWCFSTANQNAAVQQPNVGFFKKLTNASWWGLKKTAQILIPGAISDYAYRNVLKHSFWDAMKPLSTAIMRPWLERMVPFISAIYDKSNFVLKIRGWMPFGTGTAFTVVNMPFWYLKNIFSRTDRNYEAARKAYIISDKMADFTFSGIGAAKNFLWDSTQLIQSFGEAGVQNIKNSLDYMKTEDGYTSNTMIHGAKKISYLALNSGKDVAGVMLGETLSLTKDALMWGAESVADSLEYRIGWSIPAQHIYSGVVCGAATVAVTLGTKLACTAVAGAWTRLNNWAAGVGPGVANNILLNWARQSAPVQVNVQHQGQLGAPQHQGQLNAPQRPR